MTDRKIWKALADGTRRQLLDLLRGRPQTTGELCGHFPQLSRFGVMKHLQILDDAGLITIRRAGKYRWNHLNAVPLQQLYDRWVKPYEIPWAQRAVALKQHIEHQKGDLPMADSAIPVQPLSAIHVQLAVQIKAAPQQVWRQMIEDIEHWWRKDFYAFSNARMVLEARVGGRLFEDLGNGNGGLWYTVTGLQPGQHIDFSGFLRPEFGGPATSLLRISVSEKNGGTEVTISDALFGQLGDKAQTSITEGWRMLFADGLKPYIESGQSA